MMMRKMKGKIRREQLSGFTLIELSLSLVFIATLSLIIAFLVSNTVSSYRRGVILKQINTVGMDIVDDMRAAVQNSSTKSVTSDCNIVFNTTGDITDCENSGAVDFVIVKKNASKIELGAGEIITNTPMFGAFCSGTYSYIWNSGYFFTAKNSAGYPKIEGVEMAKFIYGTGSGKTLRDFRLLKVRDDDRAVCITASINGLSNNTFDIRSYGEIVSEEPIDLLKSNDIGLALYDLSTSAPADSVALNSLFYSVSFVLGTAQGGINVAASGNFCSTPNDYVDQNFDYCAINKFNFAARATGD